MNLKEFPIDWNLVAKPAWWCEVVFQLFLQRKFHQFHKSTGPRSHATNKSIPESNICCQIVSLHDLQLKLPLTCSTIHFASSTVSMMTNAAFAFLSRVLSLRRVSGCFVPFNKIGHLQPVKRFLLEPIKDIETQLLTIQREISSRPKCRIKQKINLFWIWLSKLGLQMMLIMCFDFLEPIVSCWKQLKQIVKTCLFRTTAIRST